MITYDECTVNFSDMMNKVLHTSCVFVTILAIITIIIIIIIMIKTLL